MDDRQFCFIARISDISYKEKCLQTLDALKVPEGYSKDLVTIEGEGFSVCEAYQAAMQDSQAKYKIYLEQDILILDPLLLFELLEIFQDPKIGMVGVIGTERLSGDGEIRNSDCVGTWGEDEEKSVDFYWYGSRMAPAGLQEVMAVDCRLFATQNDLLWREDLFIGNRLFVTAQALEYKKAGFRVVVMPKRCDGEMYRTDGVFIYTAADEKDRLQLLHTYGSMIYGERPRKRILYPDKSFVSLGIPQALALLDVDVLFAEFAGEPYRKMEKDIRQISGVIRALHPDAVMTHDYYVSIAMACARHDIPYISWIYDSIQIALYDDSVTLPTNYIFDFDRFQARETEERGAAFVCHQPLAANPYPANDMVINQEDINRFQCDVSFVGSLYSEDYFRIPYDSLNEEVAEECRKLLRERLGKWGEIPRFAGKLSDRAIDEISQKCLASNIYDRQLIGDRRYIEETFFSRGVTRLERIEMLKKLGTTGFDVRLFTHQNALYTCIPGVKIAGTVDYTKELPKVYNLSRINLNITLPSIRSGVPLRVYDILAAGGFLLTNDQPELEELFEVGRDLEVYHSFEEMIDKVRYYLCHEKERLRIALHGHRKVLENYTYETRIKTILEMVSRDLEQKGREGLR